MPSDAQLARVLRDQGFSDPEEWIRVARDHRFERVSATFLTSCPDCEGRRASVVGEYVYYSNLARLKICASCRLWYSDLRLDATKVQEHFERTYKDDEYFRKRAPIFRQGAKIVADLAPGRGRVLDVGGATGHFLDAIAKTRPDLRLVLNDLSESACRAAGDGFGFEAIAAGIRDLCALDQRFDILTLLDVIYYEPDLKSLWRLLCRLVRPGGSIVIRVPNLAPAIRWLGRRRFRIGVRERMGIPFFNPEHLYVFTLDFLESRLRRLGFEHVRVVPSRLLGTGRLEGGVYAALRVLGPALPGFQPLTPSVFVVARNGERS